MTLFKTDEDCIKEVQKNKDPSALQELITRHSGIYLKIIHQMIPRNYNDNSKLELIEEKDSFIYQCALEFDPSINIKFSTFIGNQTRWKCLNLYNKAKRRREKPLEENYDEPSPSGSRDETEKNELRRIISETLASYPDSRAKTIYHLRYVDGKGNKVMPWKNISKKLDMSIQGCINIHNKFIQTIKHKYEQGNPKR